MVAARWMWWCWLMIIVSQAMAKTSFLKRMSRRFCKENGNDAIRAIQLRSPTNRRDTAAHSEEFGTTVDLVQACESKSSFTLILSSTEIMPETIIPMYVLNYPSSKGYRVSVLSRLSHTTCPLHRYRSDLCSRPHFQRRKDSLVLVTHLAHAQPSTAASQLAWQSGPNLVTPVNSFPTRHIIVSASGRREQNRFLYRKNIHSTIRKIPRCRAPQPVEYRGPQTQQASYCDSSSLELRGATPPPPNLRINSSFSLCNRSICAYWFA